MKNYRVTHLGKIIFILVLFAINYKPFPAFAHLIGQPPFFKVNGVYAGFYTVSSTSLDNFNLPQDAAPHTYLVNTPLDFELDINQLPVPAEIVKKTTFAWNFGDGQTGDGLKNTHIYNKIGSFILSITASYTDNGQTVPPQILETIMVHILPNTEYQLPKAILQINGQTIHNPSTDTMHFEPGKPVTLDATASSAPSSKISAYFWDLGDSTTSNKKKLTHTYSSNYQLAFPMLRIRDTNGFIVDTYAQLDSNPGKGKVAQSRPQTPIKKNFQIIWYLVGGVLLFFIGVFILFKRRRK